LASRREHGRKSPKSRGIEKPRSPLFAAVRWSAGRKRDAERPQMGRRKDAGELTHVWRRVRQSNRRGPQCPAVTQISHPGFPGDGEGSGG
jgi:hypothetical protein